MSNPPVSVRAAASLAAALFLSLLAREAGARQDAPAPPLSPPEKAPALARDPDAELKSALLPILTTTRTPAVAVAVFDAQKLLAKAAAGVRARGAPDTVTTADRWHIGSVSKSFTATLIGLLVQDGKLAWDTTLEKALPEAAPRMHADFRGVTIEDLLRHRAGIAAFTDGRSPDFEMLKGLNGSTNERRAAFVAKLLSLEPTIKPGVKQVYSNAGYAVAAAIAEAATGSDYESLMNERVFAPLAITHAGFGWPATPARRDEPRGHMPGLLGATAQAFDPQYKLDPVMAPAGDIHCPIEELAAFARMHLRALQEEPGTPAPLLKPDTAKALHSPIDGYAAGWVIDTKSTPERHWHNGSAGTFYTLMVIVPERGIGAVAVSNSGEGEKACVDAVEAALEMVPR